MPDSRIRLLRGTPRGSEVTLGETAPGTAEPASGGTHAGAPVPPGALEEANERVLEIVEEAIRESAAIRQRAYQEGYSAGAQEGQGAARADLAGALGLVSAVANEARQLRNALLRNSEAEIVELSIDVARAVIGDALALDPRAVRATVERALGRASTMNIVRIRVHPDDVSQVVAFLAESGASASASWDVTPDGAIGVAGCVIDVEGGEIDARLDVQFDIVAGALRSLVPAPPELRQDRGAARAA